MAIRIIPKKIQSIWEVWNLRGAVLVSLFCQILLICCASMRKRKASYYTQIVVWSAYLLADWVAAVAVGLISSTQGEKCEKVTVNDNLAAFWAPFLLLHLGGPDTITAFSLEDNELWIRHMLGLVVELLAVAYVFSQSIPNDFWLPTVLVFLAGSIKYAERTRALYRACLGNFKDSMHPKPDPGPNYVKLMEEYTSMQAAHLPSIILRLPEPKQLARAFDIDAPSKDAQHYCSQIDIIQDGYKFFSIFKGLVVNHLLSLRDRKNSRMLFLSLKSQEAFSVMEVELNFLFDALFTKMAAVHNEVFRLGYIFRFTCTASIVAALVLFIVHDKSNIHRFDIAVTRALLIGAIFLDLIALIKLIFSDWTIALLGRQKKFSRSTVLSHRKVASVILAIHRRISFGSRWSKTVYKHSLISYCLKKQKGILDDIADFFGFKEILEEVLYKREKKINEELVEFIFEVLKDKAEQANETEVAKEICSSKGEWTLHFQAGIDYTIPESIMSSVREDVDYDQSVLTWHIATELCFFTSLHIVDENRERCKLLSDYLLYLLIMRPTMMSSVAGIAQIRFQDTCAEAERFFSLRRSELKDEEAACKKILEVNTVAKPVEIKGEGSKSALFDGCILAKELMNMGAHRWEVMSKVWLELLCYGACNSEGYAHAQQLSKGGELVTFVWLLMAHLGLGRQFRAEAGRLRANLIVGK